jgi:hypothetical protein
MAVEMMRPGVLGRGEWWLAGWPLQCGLDGGEHEAC